MSVGEYKVFLPGFCQGADNFREIVGIPTIVQKLSRA
jgi:hypothetical protein